MEVASQKREYAFNALVDQISTSSQSHIANRVDAGRTSSMSTQQKSLSSIYSKPDEQLQSRGLTNENLTNEKQQRDMSSSSSSNPCDATNIVSTSKRRSKRKKRALQDIQQRGDRCIERRNSHSSLASTSTTTTTSSSSLEASSIRASNMVSNTTSTSTGVGSMNTDIAVDHYHYAKDAPPPSWDTFVRQGTRLKTFLSDAMHQVRRHQIDAIDSSNGEQRDDHGEFEQIHTNNHIGNIDNNGSTATTSRVRRSTTSKDGDNRQQRGGMQQHAEDLAREKTYEALMLQQQLKQAQADISALESSNTTLRDQVATSQSRLEKTVQALRIAGGNAAKARDDAEAAEATAQTLAQSLEALKTVVEETKLASQVLHKEHQEVAARADVVQRGMLEKEEQLARALAEWKGLQKAHSKLEKESTQWKHERSALEGRIAEKERQVLDLQRTLSDARVLEEARKERANQLQREWQEARESLLQATEGQKKAQQTQANLQQSLSKLQQENQKLHSKLNQAQDQARLEKRRLSQDLLASEQKVQELRIQVEAAAERSERLEADKVATEKQVSILKSRVATLEHQLEEATLKNFGSSPARKSITSTRFSPGRSSASAMADDSPSKGRNCLPPKLPALQTAKDDTFSTHVTAIPKITSPRTCCLCNRASFGIMNACQCGKPDCDKRAHIMCINRIQAPTSVSHPGTPAPRLPTILCGSIIPSCNTNNSISSADSTGSTASSSSSCNPAN